MARSRIGTMLVTYFFGNRVLLMRNLTVSIELSSRNGPNCSRR